MFLDSLCQASHLFSSFCLQLVLLPIKKGVGGERFPYFLLFLFSLGFARACFSASSLPPLPNCLFSSIVFGFPLPDFQRLGLYNPGASRSTHLSVSFQNLLFYLPTVSNNPVMCIPKPFNLTIFNFSCLTSISL